MKSILDPAFFCYSHTELVNLGNGLSATPLINISNDADFEVFEIRAIINSAVAFTGGLFVSLSLAGGELFSNVAIDYKSIAVVEGIVQIATGGYPIRLPRPTRIPANSQINVLVNNQTGQAVDFQLQLWGYKVEKKSEAY